MSVRILQFLSGYYITVYWGIACQDTIMYVRILHTVCVVTVYWGTAWSGYYNGMSGYYSIMCLLCREFGAKVLNLKVLMKAVPSLFEHSDKNVRAEVS